MPGNLFIIHRSEVIQNGFKAMLKTFCKRKIWLYPDVKSFLAEANPAAHDLVMVEAVHAYEIKSAQKLLIDTEVPVSADMMQVSIYTDRHTLQAKIEHFDEKPDDHTKEYDDPNALSERETEVLKLVACGNTNKEIADKLFISIHTVISHRKNITDKLSIKSISGLTVYAILNHLIDSENLDASQLI